MTLRQDTSSGNRKHHSNTSVNRSTHSRPQGRGHSLQCTRRVGSCRLCLSHSRTTTGHMCSLHSSSPRTASTLLEHRQDNSLDLDRIRKHHRLSTSVVRSTHSRPQQNRGIGHSLQCTRRGVSCTRSPRSSICRCSRRISPSTLLPESIRTSGYRVSTGADISPASFCTSRRMAVAEPQ